MSIWELAATKPSNGITTFRLGKASRISQRAVSRFRPRSWQTASSPPNRQTGGIGGTIGWHGEQNGVVSLAERKVRISKPRLRQKGKGESREVEIPAYAAMRTQSRIGGRMLDILMRGVSTRNYAQVLPEMAETVGVSKSQVSRTFVEASEKSLKELMERCFDEKDILIVYIDGIVFGTHHVIVAIGVDTEGQKHVLGLRDGASESARELLANIESRWRSLARGD